MQSRPEDVRFVMIDPKRVELSGFALIPHLAFSNIVVDMEKVVGTLGAVIHEMEARYKKFAALAVRNIEAYNKHPKVDEKLPYWVVIIDELADLMMAAPFEVERQICRLAQLARATGIHLVVATQRPSVDVITGLIKANFPTRIAFAMSSQVDSRTILDMAGAERLLGRGDMLYMPTDASQAEARAGRLRLRRRDRPPRRLLGRSSAPRTRPWSTTTCWSRRSTSSSRPKTTTRCSRRPRRWPKSTPASPPRCCSAACASATRARPASWTVSKKRATRAAVVAAPAPRSCR